MMEPIYYVLENQTKCHNNQTMNITNHTHTVATNITNHTHISDTNYTTTRQTPLTLPTTNPRKNHVFFHEKN